MTKIVAGVLFVALGLAISGPAVALAGTSSAQDATQSSPTKVNAILPRGGFRHDARKSSNIG